MLSAPEQINCTDCCCLMSSDELAIGEKWYRWWGPCLPGRPGWMDAQVVGQSDTGTRYGDDKAWWGSLFIDDAMPLLVWGTLAMQLLSSVKYPAVRSPRLS
jgi:hypothetical protein